MDAELGDGGSFPIAGADEWADVEKTGTPLLADNRAVPGNVDLRPSDRARPVKQLVQGGSPASARRSPDCSSDRPC